MSESENFQDEVDTCARCGSSMGYTDCWWCAQSSRPDPHCPEPGCEGTGTVPICLSKADWCAANPLPGREHVDRHTTEDDFLAAASREGSSDG